VGPIFCTGGGQLCNTIATVPVSTLGGLKVEFIASRGHCSSIIIHLLVDGVERFTSGPLGADQSTGVQDVGPVSPGSHVIGLQAEGITGGCNTGFLESWAGTLKVTRLSEPNSSRLRIVGAGGEATIHPGQCVTLAFEVRPAGTQTYVDVTNDPNTSYSSIPSHAFAGNVFCAQPADVGKNFTLYATYRDPHTGVQTTSTALLKVRS
jgi:hypothetical protein